MSQYQHVSHVERRKLVSFSLTIVTLTVLTWHLFKYRHQSLTCTSWQPLPHFDWCFIFFSALSSPGSPFDESSLVHCIFFRSLFYLPFCLMAHTLNESDCHPMDMQVNARRKKAKIPVWKISVSVHETPDQWLRREKEKVKRKGHRTKRSRLLLTLIVAPAGWSNGWKDLVFN